MTRRAAARSAANWSLSHWVRLAATGALVVSLAGGPSYPARATDEIPPPGLGSDDGRRLAALIAARSSDVASDDYPIGPEDVLDVRVPDLREPDRVAVGQPVRVTTGEPVAFHRRLRVESSGLITLPLVGAVRAEGCTARQLEREIATRLSEARLVSNPRPTIRVMEFHSHVVTIAGSVARPGLYPLPRPGATVADLIWAAGGPTRDAGRVVELSPAAAARVSDAPPTELAPAPVPTTPDDPAPVAWLAIRDVQLEPAGLGRRLVLTLTRSPDRVQTFGLDNPPRLVLDLSGPGATEHAQFTRRALGDTVVAAVRTAPHESRLRAVIDFAGHAVKETVRHEGTRLIVDFGDTAPPVEPALEVAAPPPVELVGETPQTVKTPAPIRIDLELLLHAAGAESQSIDPPVRAGDVITVPSAGHVLIDGWVDRPGSYPVTRDLTVSRAITGAGGRLYPADIARVTVRRPNPSGGERSYVLDLDRIARGEAPDVPMNDGDVVRVPASRVRLVPWSLWRAASALF